jgi:hypothetical protein
MIKFIKRLLGIKQSKRCGCEIPDHYTKENMMVCFLCRKIRYSSEYIGDKHICSGCIKKHKDNIGFAIEEKLLGDL